MQSAVWAWAALCPLQLAGPAAFCSRRPARCACGAAGVRSLPAPAPSAPPCAASRLRRTPTKSTTPTQLPQRQGRTLCTLCTRHRSWPCTEPATECMARKFETMACEFVMAATCLPATRGPMRPGMPAAGPGDLPHRCPGRAGQLPGPHRVLGGQRGHPEGGAAGGGSGGRAVQSGVYKRAVGAAQSAGNSFSSLVGGKGNPCATAVCCSCRDVGGRGSAYCWTALPEAATNHCRQPCVRQMQRRGVGRRTLN